MPRRSAEVAAVSALAAIVSVIMAAAVIRAPSERVFGMEIVGRHHDPFTVMAQIGGPIALSVYTQPVTDVTGALLARVSGAVAAYNWLVLLSFPLAAATAFLLARHLTLSAAGATVAAMAYAFSPFHLAHAAYHPHVAQTQWVPLYLLALWRCLDDASPLAVGFLGVAALCVTLSNFYGGLIAAVITPVAACAYWLATWRTHTRSWRRLVVTIGTLVLIAVCGAAYASYAAHAVVVNRAAFAFPREDLFRYSAKWWAYLMPPVSHPLLGATAHRVWNAAGVGEGLLEQQVSLGWGIVALGLIAIVRWVAVPLSHGQNPDSSCAPVVVSACGATQKPNTPSACERPPQSLALVPVLVIVAIAALVCSLSPERTIGTVTFVRPSSFLYTVVPMFRSYARFGVVVQLMAALLAGIGVECLGRASTTRARIACVLFVTLAVCEYTVAPSALWRDVLPTRAHRWVAQQPGPLRVLDCTARNPESESIGWLTGDRVTLLGGSISDCTDDNLSQKLAANRYTHLLVRRDTVSGRWFADHPTPDGLRVAARFDDGAVFAVTAPIPAIYTAAVTGFFPGEHDAAWAWRWMGAAGEWTIVNTGARPIFATLCLEMSAFHRARRMEVLIDERPVQTLLVEPARRLYLLDPLTVLPGDHLLVFRPVEGPTRASDVTDGGDPRLLSFAMGTWHWAVQGAQP